MVSIFKKRLDELMGKNRNIPPEKQPDRERYTDRDVK
jgi:hypothetical protein